MADEVYFKNMACGNCGNTWLQKVPVGYLISQGTQGNPIAKEEKGTNTIKDYTCPTCGTKSNVRWD